MASVFGSCKDVDTFVTIEENLFDANGNEIIRFTSADGANTFDVCKNPLKGATLNGEPVDAPDGILILEDMFGAGVVSADGSTYTVTLPGQAPVDICLNPVKTVSTVDANGVLIEGPNAPDADGNADAVGSTATPSADGTQHNILTSDGVVTSVCLNPAKSTVQDPATGVITTTYADGTTDTSDTKYSTTVPAPAGFHTITTDDGVATAVCLTPLKSINGVTGDINGNVNVADLFSNTVDNGDNTYTTTNSDGTDVTWSGDTFASQMDNGDGTVTFTMADGSTVTLCLNPVKTAVQNADGLGATVTYADGTTGQLAYPTSTAVSDGVTTTTTHPDGTTHTSCDDPVKDVLDSEGVSVVDENGVATLPPAATSSFSSNGDGTTTHDDGNGNVTTNIQEAIVDGGSNLVAADGVTIGPIEKWGGAVFDAAVDQIVTDNAVKSVECEGQSVRHTFCDDTAIKHNPSYFDCRVGVSIPRTPIPVGLMGPLDFTEGCCEVTIPDCGGRLLLTAEWSGESEFGTGFVQFWPEFSLDGGATWSPWVTAGNDTIASGMRDVGNAVPGAGQAYDDNEFSHSERRMSNFLQGGVYIVCFRNSVQTNTLTTSPGVVLNSHTYFASYIGEVCCNG